MLTEGEGVGDGYGFLLLFDWLVCVCSDVTKSAFIIWLWPSIFLDRRQNKLILNYWLNGVEHYHLSFQRCFLINFHRVPRYCCYKYHCFLQNYLHVDWNLKDPSLYSCTSRLVVPIAPVSILLHQKDIYSKGLYMTHQPVSVALVVSSESPLCRYVFYI